VGRLVDSEEPDILVDRNGHTVLGVEVTEYLRDRQVIGGSESRRGEATRAAVHQAILRELATRGAPPLGLGLVWRSTLDISKALGKADAKREGAALADLILSRLPPRTGGSTEITVAELASAGPDRVLTGISIQLDPRNTGSAIAWDELGPQELQPHEIQAIISEKDQRVPAYLKACPVVWLLITVEKASGDVSRSAVVSQLALVHSYSSSFSKVLLIWLAAQDQIRHGVATDEIFDLST
jgi:hypothetical protein